MALRRSFCRSLLASAGAALLVAPAAVVIGQAPVAAAPTVPASAVAASPRSAGTVALGPSVGGLAMVAAAPNVPKGTGPVRNGTLEEFPLGDKVEARVNVGSGNLLVLTQDLILPGVSEDVTLGEAYNSLLVGSGIADGTHGRGWRTRFGIDIRLIEADDDSVTYVAADGVVGVFQPSGAGYSSPGEFKASLARDGSGWKLTEHESGKELYFTSAGLLDRVADRNDNVTDVTYGSGRMTGVSGTRGAATARNAYAEYDGYGRLVRWRQNNADGSQSRAVQYAYTGDGDLAEITYPTGRKVSFEYDGGRRLNKINVGGRVTKITYDGQHRVTSLTRVTNTATGEGATTRFAYPSSTETHVADANTDLSRPVADVPHTTYTVNSDKRVTKAVDPAGNERSTSYTPFFDVATSTNAEGGTTLNTFGANGGQSLTQSASATGASISIAYANPATADNPTANFQPSSYTDTQNNTSTLEYNGAGNRTSATDATAARAEVDYNDDGTVGSTTDPGNGDNATTYAYDANKQLTTITPPTGNSLGVRRFTYDKFGRIKTVNDGAGRITTYDYSLDDRVQSISYSDGTPTVTFDYDAAGNLTSRVDGAGATTFGYDPLNRLTSRNGPTGGPLSYTYDPVGNLKTLTDARGTTRYTYNARNLLVSMTTAGGTRYAFAYDGDGRRTHTYFGANSDASQWVARTRTTYDDSGRITRITTARDTDPNDVVFDTSYCYAEHVAGQPCSTDAGDDTGLRQWQTDHVGGHTSVFTFDEGNRLTRATDVHDHTYEYAYDARGNRLSVTIDGVTSQTLAYNSANQITTAGNSYDAAGNATSVSDPSLRLTYNAAGQQIRDVDGDHNYQYAGPDQREAVRAAHREFVYGRTDQYGLPWVQSYTLEDDHGYGGTVVGHIERDGLGTPLGAQIDGTDHFYVTDGLGSVVNILDTNGSVEATYEYDPYGMVHSATGFHATDNPIRFAGGLQDTEGTDFVKFGQRWYNPAQGRFTQQDNLAVIGDPASGNRYAYAACNPVNYTDPTGQLPESCWYAIGGLAISIITFEIGIFTSPTGWGAVAAVLGYFGILFSARGVLDSCPVD